MAQGTVGSLEQLLARLYEALASAYTSVQHGDKRVQYKSAAEVRESIKLANELESPPKTRVVANPRRPKL